ncbi:unnamed protein product [Cyprideis torosa]|uniref:Uncharacterized protein n=1 Tax=Cyprideis torosa TaxID=163714 RepID=A0A7R8ZR56_9CRUS|nr:unnamed protein product [Cyprideis torosa]CAG0898082.1 unnamed protein product [Cyprideis torosa]
MYCMAVVRIHSDGIKSGTSFGTEEEDDGHLSDFEGSGGGADSDAEGTLRHGTYVVQPYNNSTSDRSTNYARPNKHRSVDRSVDSPTSSSPSERALRRRRGMDLPPSPPSRRGGLVPASNPQLSIRAPTRSSSQDDAMSVTVEDVMEDFRSILRTQQQQLDLQEGSQMPPRSASRESRNHGLSHRSPSPRVKNGHVSPEKSMSNGPSKARTSSSSSSSCGFMNHDNKGTPKAGSRNRQQLPTYIFPPPHRSPNHQPTQDYETSDTESALSPTDVTSLQTVDSESNKSFGFVRPVSVDEGSGPHSLSFLRHLGIGSSSIESGSTKSFGFFRPQSSPTNHPSPQPHSLATPRRTEANGDGVRRSESLQFRGGVAPSSLVCDPKRSSKEKSKKHRNKEKSSSSSSLVGAYPPQSPRGPQMIGRGPPSFPRPPDWTLEWKYQPVVDKNSGLINPGTFIAKPKHFFGATNRDFRARVQAARSMEGLDRLPIFLPWGPSPMTKEVPVRNIPTPDYSTATSTTSSVRTVIRNGTIHRGPHLLDMPAGLY